MNTVANSYGVDTNWYVGTGASDHITGELSRLMVHDRYTGNNQVHAANGVGMEIAHIGQTHFHTHDRPLYLKNILE